MASGDGQVFGAVIGPQKATRLHFAESKMQYCPAGSRAGRVNGLFVE